MNKKDIGNIGEDIACKHILNKGYKIIKRNYRKSFGEIDIIAKRWNRLYFFEVKSLSVNQFNVGKYTKGHKPEENVHPLKQSHIKKVAECFISEFGSQEDLSFGVISVFIDFETSKSYIYMVENLVI